VVAVGNFDGVHLGHQRVLALAREEAARRGIAFRVVTFDPHPALLLRPEEAPPGITPLSLKAELLEAVGVETLVVVDFDSRFALLSAEDFVNRLLVSRLGARVIVQGGNFRFGRDRAGDMDQLRRLGEAGGYQVIEADIAGFEGEVISSTRIRDALAAADLEQVRQMLGRPYEVRGRVTPGTGRGRDLGFPTANLIPEGDVLVPDGVYAAEASADEGPPLPAVVHKGPRPTFQDSASLESHLIGFSGDPRRVRIRFAAFLRSIRAFADPDALVRQIGQDVAAAREILPVASPAAASR